MLKLFITLISDWLIALLVVSLLVWVVVMQPIVVPSDKEKAQVFSNMANVSMLMAQEKSLKQASEARLRSHVNKLSLVYAPRTIAYGNLNSTAHYIQQQFLELGDTRYQAYWTLNGHFSNVILELGPRTDQILVFGAHYDAENDSLDVEGNASGVATLIELARQLALHEKELPIRVQIVAYPLSLNQSVRRENTGSYNHAEQLQKAGENVKMMISLDSVGHFNEQQGSQRYPFAFMQYLYPDKGNYISLIGRLEDFSQLRETKRSFAKASSLPLYSFNTLDDFPEFLSTDHENYQRKGFPAFLLTDTAHYRQIENDMAEIPEQLDYPKMALLVRGLFQVVMDSKAINASEYPDTQVQLVERSYQSATKQLQ
jgi:hypothetical protein